ncbi:DUF5794 domain-containing protein [Halapricum hydrolyticum]|uniref:DUF5794 domain-containing protein n=1 Tax=Halapricum hydrolyticum TaxID=2979991 RepID=A0AAE3I938_9EURY|nr:DUF5794 domain-containing protein [Halapricum hydrolyticum]MCU4716793.1 DUF5794 domain-containing protein [Halapricum hydrolyticum]MCU4725602.1 DUF5794 domain-containing protein [Halapricum hydrolyticum]
MSSSQHPIALAIEQQVGGATRLLATVMWLPLVDGLFPALVLAGAIDGVFGILEVGLLVFGGSATVAVILADMDGGPREQVPKVLAVGVVLVVVAAIEAALAPTIESLLDLVTFQRFAAVVIVAVAARTASSRLGDLLPRPAMIVALGLLASLEPASATLAFSTDIGLVARGVAAGLVGVTFALLVALAGPALRGMVDLDRFRFGSAVALGMLPLSMFGLVPGDVPIALIVLVLTALLAFDPDSAGERARTEPAITDGSGGRDADKPDNIADSSSDVAEDDRYRAPWL